MKIVVTAETEEWSTRERDPNDEWDIGDTDGRVSNVVAYVDSINEHFYYGASAGKEIDATAGDTVYAVVADYNSGCTFGQSGGHADVLDFFVSNEEAEALAEAALKPDGKEDRYGRTENRYDYSFTFGGREYSRAWVGYFESLNSLDVWQVVVKSQPKDPWADDMNPGYKVGR